MDADAAHAALIALHGIGPWTADIYLLFCLGHADAFPAGDLAVQEAARIAFGLRKRPDAKALAKLAEAWRPWRGVAAHLLWAYYHAVKRRDVVPVAVEPERRRSPRRRSRRRRKSTRKSAMAELDGPRLEPRSGTAKQLVVFLHGYGADGNDLIDIGRAWQGLLPDTAFVSPHAPRPVRPGADGPRMVSARRSATRTSAGAASTRRRPALDAFLDAELDAPQPAAVGAGAGRLSAKAP